MSGNVRTAVKTAIAPHIPGTWVIKPHTVKQVSTLSRVTVFIEHTGITPLPAAPIGHLSNTVMVTVLDPHTDYDKAEDALDQNVLKLITALDGSDVIAVEKADKVTVVDAYLGWAITLTIITEKGT